MGPVCVVSRKRIRPVSAQITEMLCICERIGVDRLGNILCECVRDIKIILSRVQSRRQTTESAFTQDVIHTGGISTAPGSEYGL